MEELEKLKVENEELKSRLAAHEAPFDFGNGSSISIDVSDEGVENIDIESIKVARVNNFEFINGGLYHSLITRHFREVEESITLRTVANRMAEAIEHANSEGKASEKMLDSLSAWNMIILQKK